MGLIPKTTKTVLLSGLVFLAACAPQGKFSSAIDGLTDEPMTEQEWIESEAPTDVQQKAAEMSQFSVPQLTVMEEARILAKYDYLDPKHEVPSELLEKAVVYYDTNYANVKNKNYIAVIDLKKKSTLNRFFIVNMKTGAVLALRTAHGKGSDADHDGYAEKFSNKHGSGASSLGYAMTAGTYNSKKFGYALRMHGLSSTNSNFYARAVVIHGANYVKQAAVKQGRSLGCPAVDFDYRDQVVNNLKNGAVVYLGLSK